MDKQKIALLRTSFAEIARRRPDVAAVFYKRLFEVAPAVRALFSDDMKEQQRKLTAALAQIVATVDQPEKLTSHVSRLGQRHVGYGAQPAHYKVVGDVLLWTFEQVLKRDFTAPVRAAWTEAYTAVAGMMIEAGKQVAGATAAKKKSLAPAGAAVKAAKTGRKAAVRRVKRGASTAAAEGGKRKAARRPVRRTKQRAG
jgi:hemoglobin-like flavoprotein